MMPQLRPPAISKVIIEFLRGTAIYQQAVAQLANHQPQQTENKSALASAQEVLASVPDHYVPFKFDDLP